jgi:pilus assembly protein Flp/PilA
MEWLKKFIKEEDGVTAIEYTLIAVLIALAIVAAVTAVGNWANTALTSVSNLAPATGS